MLKPENLWEILGEGLAEVDTLGLLARSISILSCCSVTPPSFKLPSSEAVVIGTSSEAVVVVVGDRCFNLKIIHGMKSYEGFYMNDKKHGYGIFRWHNGKMYQGEWKNGKQHGRGWFFNTREWKEGVWRAGER